MEGHALSEPEIVHVLSIRGRVPEPDLPSFIRDALHEIRTHIEAHRVEVQGPPFSVCGAASAEGVDVEVGWPVGPSHGAGRIASGVLPAALIRRQHDGTGSGSHDLRRSARTATHEDVMPPRVAA